MKFFSVDHVPVELRQAVAAIDKHFASQPRYYAIDFMNTPKGWKMLELNPYLALLPVTEGQEAQETLDKLADYLVEHCPGVE
jgi:hypothetical protein